MRFVILINLQCIFFSLWRPLQSTQSPVVGRGQSLAVEGVGTFASVASSSNGRNVTVPQVLVDSADVVGSRESPSLVSDEMHATTSSKVPAKAKAKARIRPYGHGLHGPMKRFGRPYLGLRNCRAGRHDPFRCKRTVGCAWFHSPSLRMSGCHAWTDDEFCSMLKRQWCNGRDAYTKRWRMIMGQKTRHVIRFCKPGCMVGPVHRDCALGRARSSEALCLRQGCSWHVSPSLRHNGCRDWEDRFYCDMLSDRTTCVKSTISHGVKIMQGQVVRWQMVRCIWEHGRCQLPEPQTQYDKIQWRNAMRAAQGDDGEVNGSADIDEDEDSEAEEEGRGGGELGANAEAGESTDEADADADAEAVTSEEDGTEEELGEDEDEDGFEEPVEEREENDEDEERM